MAPTPGLGRSPSAAGRSPRTVADVEPTRGRCGAGCRLSLSLNLVHRRGPLVVENRVLLQELVVTY